MAAPVGEVGGVCREYDPGGPLHMLHARAGGVDHKGVLGGFKGSKVQRFISLKGHLRYISVG